MKKSKTLSAPPVGAHTSERKAVATGKSPKLKTGKDKEVALELGRLVRDAQDGTRRILICGLFIEHIVANLSRGQLGPWIDAYKKEIGGSRASIFAWKAFASDLLKDIGIAKVQLLDFSIPLHQTMALPAAEVPKDSQEIREKIDELIEGKSVRQLELKFRESEVHGDELIRTGKGGPRNTGKKLDRRSAEEIAQAAAMEEAELWHDILKVRLERGLDSEQKHWRWLQPEQCTTLRRLLKDLHALMGEPLPPLHDAAKERRILKDLAQHPDAQS